MSARVAWISIAPVKGLGLVHPDEVLLESFGVRENRRFHLVGADGRMLNGKRLGTLVRVAPDYDDSSGVLTLRFPDGTAVTGEVALGEAVVTEFFGRPVPGRLVVGGWSDALSAWAGQALALVRPESPGEGVDRGSGAGVSLVSTASLFELARAAGLAEPVDGRRFRMLLGVEGVGAHEEDTWLSRRVRVGDAVIVPRGNVGRCAVTTHNPETGVRDLDTLGTLEAYRGRTQTTEPLAFGVWGEVAQPGRVRVGDPVEPA